MAITVRLTHPGDFMRHRRGDLPQSQLRSLTAEARIDPAAFRSVVPRKLLDRLGIDTFGECAVLFPDGRREVVPLSEAVLFTLEGREAIEDTMVCGDSVSIGSTLLSRTGFYYDTKTGKLIGHHGDEELIELIGVYD